MATTAVVSLTAPAPPLPHVNAHAHAALVVAHSPLSFAVATPAPVHPGTGGPSIMSSGMLGSASSSSATANHYHTHNGVNGSTSTTPQPSSDGFYPSPASTSYLPTPPVSSLHPSPAPHGISPAPSPGFTYPWPQAPAQGYMPVAGPSNAGRGDHVEMLNSPMSMSMQSLAMDSRSRRESRGKNASSDGDDGDGRCGVDDPFGERSYTEMKVLGDGSFGTVWLCDWHSPVKSDVLLSAMQCGAGARSEWAGKRLVALKRMKRVWEGGWQQAKNLGELVSLRRIPPHPAVIPLYDAFISPRSRELYFVFECMEGNLYQLTKSRKGRPLAAGLVASCFHQIVTGLHHIHSHGYFHRDMKPENLLVTTTGICDYLSASALKTLNSGSAAEAQAALSEGNLRYEKDVQVIIKLADFGLARATDSKPPYTEYVSTRWYRAPEVLLRSTEYGPPVDMWALGTILAEMVTLKPLFPGVSEIDQVYRICDTLGDPSPEYGVDERGRMVGGGQWNSGIKLAKNVGFSFPKRRPVHFWGLFPDTTPPSLVDCIADLLRYNPNYRMTSSQCVDHAYFHETLPHLQRTAPLPRIPFHQGQPASLNRQPQPALSAPPRQIPPSHAHQPHDARPAFANGDMRTLPPPVDTPDGMAQPPSSHVFFPSAGAGLHRSDNDPRAYSASALVHQLRELDLPTDDLASYGVRGPPTGQDFPGAEKGPSARIARWLEDPAMAAASRRPSNAHSSLYDGSVFEGSQDAHSSSASFSNLHGMTSAADLSREHAPPHVAAYVRQQQQHQHLYVDETPRAPQSSQVPMPPPVDARQSPPVPAAQSKIAGTIGKKKKWGLSSVFGGGEKGESSSTLAPVEEHGYSGSSLKRTQSGHHPAERLGPASPVVPVPSPTELMDPKKAKKEAERQARELEKAKREAAERAQKERARAVLQKRSQLIEVRQKTTGNTEIEFGEPGSLSQLTSSGGGSSDPRLHAFKQPPILTSALANAHAHAHRSSSTADVRTGGYPSPGPGGMSASAAQSAPSVRSHASEHSHNSQLSAEALAAQTMAYEAAGRHKARRRNEDDDHSQSSFDRMSLQSRSVLTVGTIDSDPGPRRARQEWPDGAHYSPKRAPSASSSHLRNLPLMSRSNASLESQLAHDFQARANVAPGPPAAPSAYPVPGVPSGRRSGSASASSLSLGRHGASQLSLEAMAMGASAPTSPYGHPKGVAVAHGVGVARPGAGGGTVLPSIGDLEGEINPMFRVPPAGGQGQPQPRRGTTLPPFSTLASVADEQHRPGSRQ